MKKNSVFLLGMLAILLTFGLALTGCDTDPSDPTDGGGDPSKVPGLSSNAQIYQSDGTTAYAGNGSIRLGVRNNGTEEFISCGTVTNGKLTLDLKTPDSKYLQDLDAVLLPSGLTVSVTGVKVLMGASLYLFDGNTNRGEIFFVKMDGTNNYHLVSFWYADKAVAVNGSYTYEGRTYTYSNTARAGWNAVYQHTTGSGTAYTTDTSKIPSGLKWVLGDSDSPSDPFNVPGLSSNAQIYQSDGTTAYAGDGSIRLGVSQEEFITCGTVANGKLTLDLKTKTLDVKYLQDLDNTMPSESGLTVSATGVKVLPDASLYLFEGETNKGPIYFYKEGTDESHNVSFWYTDKAITVTGSFDAPGGWSDTDGGSGTYTIPTTLNINASAGWNAVYTHMTNNGITITTDTSKIPGDLKWFLGDSDSSGPAPEPVPSGN